MIIVPTFQMEKLRPDISINIFHNISERREWRIMGLEKPQRAREVTPRFPPSPYLDQKGNATKAHQRESWQPISLRSRGLKLTCL